MTGLHLSMLCQPLVTAFCSVIWAPVLSSHPSAGALRWAGWASCQLQEAHLRWQPCHFASTSFFTPDHTCRWESQCFKAGGSDRGNRCQMDMLMCRRGQWTLHLSATRAGEAGALCADSCCDRNPIAWSGISSETKRRAGGSTLMGTQRWGFPAGKVDFHWLCLAELSLCGVWNPSPRLDGRTLSLIFLTSSGTQLLSTHTGLNPYMIKLFRGLGEVRKWWGLVQWSVLHSDVLMLIYKSF